MASGTEKALWTRLQGVALETSSRTETGMHFTRIECSSALGVSDVEYVMLPRHGWIELKAATSKGDSKPLRLHEPFKATQAQWLISHHSPANNLHSFLLVGIMGQREWKEYLVLTARASLALLHRRLAPTYGTLKQTPGVVHCTNMKSVLRAISR
jgi:hypothetical protein